ncbi:MAG: glycogen synthase [candidate division WS1 bacterium]|jgi:starch synthase|nr:glycogen synthase [candidate division WS1 bacterium]
MKVLFVSNEVAPFAKVGGLADVAGSLPRAIAEQGVDIRVVMPRHRQCPADEECSMVLPGLSVQSPGRAHAASVLETTLPESDVPLYLVKYDPYFDRPDVYGTADADYPDSPQRYAFFARAALTLNHALGFGADLMHANDWPTGLLPAFQALNPLGTPTVFTIHNLGYQGRFPLGVAPAMDIDPASPTLPLVASGGDINFMAAAIRSATVVNTVSERYAQEIQTSAFGHGLEDLLASRGDEVHGILNGINYADWGPDVLPAGLSCPYSAQDLAGKAACKAELQKRLGLPVDPTVPLAVAVSRLVWQKGLDILAEALPRIVRLPAQFAVLGSGDHELESLYLAMAQANPERIAAQISYDEDMARLFYAGADIFIMPSRYEPCGLSQIIAMAYGAVPVVHGTGGLADTVTEAAPEPTGFVAEHLVPLELIEATERAVTAYRQPKRWQALVRRVMRQEFSWDRSATKYLALYERALTAR